MSRSRMLSAHSECMTQRAGEYPIVVETRTTPTLTPRAAAVLLRILHAAADGPAAERDGESRPEGEALRVAS
jgi:hypothetical protein